jgi:hypothetical protein
MKPSFVAIALLASLSMSRAFADTVHDGRGSFADVKIIGLRDDELSFRMPDGRVLNRSAVNIRYVTIEGDREPMTEVLTAAERFRSQRRHADAIPLYVQVHRAALASWITDFAAMRLAQSQDQLGQFSESLDTCMNLAVHQPILARSALPRMLPL